MSYNKPGVYTRVSADGKRVVKHVITSRNHAIPLSAVLKGNMSSLWDPSQYLSVRLDFELPIEFLKKGD